MSHANEMRQQAKRLMVLADRRERLSGEPEDQEAAKRLRDVAAGLISNADHSEALEQATEWLWQQVTRTQVYAQRVQQYRPPPVALSGKVTRKP